MRGSVGAIFCAAAKRGFSASSNSMAVAPLSAA
jgi:hypothetical protein